MSSPQLAASKFDAIEDEVRQLFSKTGIDLSLLPQLMSPEDAATALGTTIGQLAQDRMKDIGVPYIKVGRRVRYARVSLARYLIDNYKPTKPRER